MAGDPETSLSQITVGVTGYWFAETSTTLGQIAIRVARCRAADAGSALRLIEVGRDSCEATGHLRPALSEVDVRSSLLRDLGVGHPIGIGFRDLPLPCARGEGEPGSDRDERGGDDALGLLRGVHAGRFTRAGMAPPTYRYGTGMGAFPRR